ncbi:hypothetical protein TSUD_297060 [Trifolium subterraneum]|uniref:Uncharacterized protein n=1 Tax=Trifolium subterraneum TaxID=3900 RepID=A0A2Z6NAZ1_TRISU|nr:hypothetical protein TSUD_297060 [Trifolium subterraneum]
MTSSSHQQIVATPLPQITNFSDNLKVSGNLATRQISQIQMICGKMNDFESLSVNKFNVKDLFSSQGLDQYFNLLDGLIYANLVQEFWMKAWVLDRKYATAQEEEMITKNPEMAGKTRAEMALLRITNSGKQIKNYENDGIRTHRKALEKIIEKPIIYSKDGKEMEKKGLHGKTSVLTDEMYVVLRILIHCLIPRFGDAPEMKHVPKRKRSSSTLKQSNSSTKKPKRSSPQKLPEVTPSEPITQNQPNVITDSKTESDDNQTLAAGILRKRSIVSPTKSSSISPIAKKPRPTRRLYTQLTSSSQSSSPSPNQRDIQQSPNQLDTQQHSSQTQPSPQHMLSTSQQFPLSTLATSPSQSPHYIIITTPPSTPEHNIAQEVTPSTPHIIHLSASSLLASLQHDISHLAYLRDEAVIHPDELFHEFHKVQDYFNASMNALATQNLVLNSVNFAEAATVQWYEDNDLSEEEQPVCNDQHTTPVVDEVIATNQNATLLVDEDIPCLKNAQDATPVVAEESNRLDNEASQPLLQIHAEPSVSDIAARLATQEATQHEMQHQITSLVDSQSEIKKMLALILARQQPPNP